jgi:hemerythrin
MELEKIVWSPTFSVGVKSLDDQHRQIVDMINLLIVDEQATVRSETISELLTRLTRYAEDHFTAEERLLEEYGYPELASQKEEHRKYRQRIVGLCKDAMLHQDSVPADLLQFIIGWWMNHILDTDMQYRSFFEELGVR